MIISHRYQFIFIKTHKTAGSSMEIALGALCGPEDVVTPMAPNVGQNFHDPSWLARSYASSRILRKCLNRHSPLLGKWYYEHMPATRVRALVGEEIWRTYHKFCFERNPWEKVVSYYNWKRFGQKRKLPEFRQYVLEKSHRLPTDADLYLDGDDQCLMDEVLDFSDFRASFEALCRRLAIPYSGNMPREKTNITQQPVDYRTYYDEESCAKVAACYAREIRLFGYQFDPPSRGTPAGAMTPPPEGRVATPAGRGADSWR
jgi:hypothetical protein